ncbi:hypothetical protein M404DRAFT_633163 [Pisolithus tinctorius Marx 270]|uniref:Uncharacterized protein n=1 Tax=Pisolithus tinctorius Marx 270 TaxID=870435 RepID=A0A0C3J1Y1_PISTI|nr:hypothetical protein M404DRAFT_633163 [Pisolithus tinctorius Marx 270]
MCTYKDTSGPQSCRSLAVRALSTIFVDWYSVVIASVGRGLGWPKTSVAHLYLLGHDLLRCTKVQGGVTFTILVPYSVTKNRRA